MCLAWSQPRMMSGEVGVVMVRTADRACWRLDADPDESRTAALIALIGGLDGYRRDVI